MLYLVGALALTAGCEDLGLVNPRSVPTGPIRGGVATAGISPVYVYRAARANPPNQRLRSGTGFFVSSGGLFVTSAHVVDGCREVLIWPRRGGPFTGETIALDRMTDIALLSTGQPTAQYAAIIRPYPPSIGSQISTLGYGVIVSEPRKPIINRGVLLATTLTSTGKPLLVIRSVFHEGNSGGPVIDDRNELIGMVIGRATDQPDHGLAVPSSDIGAFLFYAGVTNTAELAGHGPRPRPSDFLNAISALVQCQSEAAIDYAPRLEVQPNPVGSSSRPFGWVGWLFGYGR